MYYHRFKTKVCDIILVGNEQGISQLLIDNNTKTISIDKDWEKSDSLFLEAQQQIEEYFLGNRKKFDLKLNPQGTDFQNKVWDALQDIPSGEFRTYKEVATSLGNPDASRAVGLANNKNPIPILIPCHRVIGANGKLVGYAYGIELKRELLNLERVKTGLF